MSGTSTGSADAKGKVSPTGEMATQSPSTIVDTQISAKAVPSVPQGKPVKDIFAIAGQIEALLKGVSNKEALKILSAVGSQHNLRTISMDRPIGQSTTGTVKAGPPPSTVQKKGKASKKGPTPPAAWKQTDEYHHLSGLHRERVEILKSLDPATVSAASIEDAKNDLREVERKLKDLKKRTAGDQ
jgi:hypothetical protein